MVVIDENSETIVALRVEPRPLRDGEPPRVSPTRRALYALKYVLYTLCDVL